MKHRHYDVLVAWLADQTLELERMAVNDWIKVIPMDCNPISDPGLEWRIKPKMVKVGRHEWPMPLEEVPEANTMYCLARTPLDCELPSSYRWTGTSVDHLWLKQGLIHLSAEAAQQHARALVCINKGDIQ